MKAPLFVRPLSDDERRAFQAGLRSPVAFTFKRCQILLASDQGQTPRQIAENLASAPSSVRHVLHAFEAEGLDCLKKKSSRPKSAQPTLGPEDAERLIALLHQSPRTFGKPTSLWTLDLLAELCHERGWTPRRFRGETIRQSLKRLGIHWKRAKHWITSPDPAYARKKKRETA